MLDLTDSSEQAKDMEPVKLHVTGGSIQMPSALYRVKKLKSMHVLASKLLLSLAI